jgi:hypothetical protein
MKANSLKWRPVFSLSAILLTTLLVVLGCGGGGGGSTTSPTGTNNAPVASDSAITTSQDTPVNGTLSASDADGDALTYTMDAAPTRGVVNITDTATGAFTYTPNAGQNGSDSFTFHVSDGQEDSNVATVTVTISGVNAAPTAVAPADFNADELSTVSLDGTGSDDAEDGAAGLDYSWTQTGGTPSVALLNANTDTAQFSAPAIESGTSVDLTFTLTVTDSGTLTAEDTVVVTIDAAGHIIGASAAPIYHTDLTQEGTLDWAAWGLLTDNSFSSKNGGTNDLVDFTDIGTVTRVRSTGNPVTFSWTDGSPTGGPHETADHTATRVRFTGADVDEGLRLSVPAGVEDKILKIYLGAYSHKGKVTVSLLNDSGVTPYTVSLDNPDDIQGAWVVTILFGASADGDTLQVDYTVEEDTGGTVGGHINLAAAALMSAQALTPTMSPLPGTYTDPVSLTLATTPTNATIRYTDDGTAPTSTSTVYSSAVSLSADTTVNAQAFYPGLNNSSVASGTYDIDTTAAGTLMANADSAPFHTFLHQEGTLDWAAWGLLTESSFTSKNGGTDALSDFTAIGTITRVRSTGNPVTMSWTGGSPTGGPHETASETPTRVLLADGDLDENEGFRLTIPANEVEKTLRVYLGAYSVEGKVTVYMEDGSIPEYTTTLSGNSDSQEAWVVTVDFATAAGTTSNLFFDYVQGADVGSVAGGHINIAAATLAD